MSGFLSVFSLQAAALLFVDGQKPPLSAPTALKIVMNRLSQILPGRR
jgi:hypothetical protein